VSDGGVRVVQVIVSEAEGTIGGADVHVLELAAAQQATGVLDPVVLAPRSSAEFRRRARALGVRVVAPQQLGLRGLWVLGRETAVVHAHGYDADFWVAALRATPAWRSAAAVFTAHGFIETSPWLRALTQLDLGVLRTADAVIACSNDLVARLARAGVTAPVAEIVNGVPLPITPPAGAVREVREVAGAVDGEPLVAFIGRLADEKHPDTFVRAAAAVAAAEPRCRFVICGAGPARPLVERVAAAHGLDGRLTLLGFRPDVAAVLGAADVLVSTSDSESTPRMLAEAMRAGVPVVAAAVGGVTEIVEHGVTGMLAPPAAPAATAAHVLRLLADPGLRDALARAACERAERELTVESMEARVRETYAVAWSRRDARVSRRGR
jgi:glycosyltransferase involved in cell wall biosynthesis